MIDPTTVAGGVVGGKKLIGIIAMAISSEKIIEGLPLLFVVGLPLLTAAYFVGTTSQEIEHIHTTIKENSIEMRVYVDARVKEDKWKINYVYEQATKGQRFTFADGERCNKRITVLEEKAEGHSRFEAEGKRLEKRLEKCEERITGK